MYCDLFVHEKFECTAFDDLFLFKNIENFGCLCVVKDCEGSLCKFDKLIDFLKIGYLCSEDPDFL